MQDVLSNVLEAIRKNERICMPNQFSGTQTKSLYEGSTEGYRYLFEGEEDLLHLIVTKEDKSEVEPENALKVAKEILNGVPGALIWMKPGKSSYHFYLGHDELLVANESS